MKNCFLIITAILSAMIGACNKNSDGPAPVNNPNPYINQYAGTYNGLYEASNNGVDSTGVFKIDTSYEYSINILDGGNYTITINYGPININSIPVDSNGAFFFEDYNHNITGQFTDDSLFLSSDALNGYYDSIYFSGSWFVIQKLSFRGKKDL
jgi:hypothetical protein